MYTLANIAMTAPDRDFLVLLRPCPNNEATPSPCADGVAQRTNHQVPSLFKEVAFRHGEWIKLPLLYTRVYYNHPMRITLENRE